MAPSGRAAAAAVDAYVFATMAAPAAGAPTAPTPPTATVPTTPAPPTAAAAVAAAAVAAAAAAAAVDLLHDSDQNVLACLGKLMSVRTPSGQSIQ